MATTKKYSVSAETAKFLEVLKELDTLQGHYIEAYYGIYGTEISDDAVDKFSALYDLLKANISDVIYSNLASYGDTI